MTWVQWLVAVLVGWLCVLIVLVGLWTLVVLSVEWLNRRRHARRRASRGGHLDHEPGFGDRLAGDFPRSAP